MMLSGSALFSSLRSDGVAEQCQWVQGAGRAEKIRKVPYVVTLTRERLIDTAQRNKNAHISK